jgi:hypothetical protein
MIFFLRFQALSGADAAGYAQAQEYFKPMDGGSGG